MDRFDGSYTNLRSQLKASHPLPTTPSKAAGVGLRSAPSGAYEIRPHLSSAQSCQDSRLLSQLNQIPCPEDVYRKDSFCMDTILTARPRWA